MRRIKLTLVWIAWLAVLIACVHAALCAAGCGGGPVDDLGCARMADAMAAVESLDSTCTADALAEWRDLSARVCGRSEYSVCWGLRVDLLVALDCVDGREPTIAVVHSIDALDGLGGDLCGW